MFGKSRTKAMKDKADSGAALAIELAGDKKFRKELLSALGHGAVAGERARRRIGPIATVNRLATDEELREELTEMSKSVRRAKGRLEKKRSHRLRNMLLMTGAATVVAIPQTRQWLTGQIKKLRSGTETFGSSFDEAQADADKPISRMTKDELVERAQDEGVEVRDDMSRDEVYEALRARERA